ncbi:MAG: flagellar hook-associated protein FlgK [Clostridiales bacterium]|uniref:flagellar hook-associated protein FlgK n=1 Tax=Roseburia sp. MSJ-14 TaxID=2841514 RepID=UPI00169FEDAB|nr:flagellar hook-associated protein FlgK [Roseburia sp. MSJ-14]MBU5474808.1 flagellar hook-associated protein FlgK [Roseburia sp. MSJ-14]NLK78890.1 flagellar hook-associated protein FlgK [Clostridiales bacterium]
MANGMGSLYIGASGLQQSQNALNTTANNLANVETTGYVRQQVLFADRDYNTFDTKSAISKQQAGLGVNIADVVHTRDYFLDKYYRTENGRQAFYDATNEAVQEVITSFQELEGTTFQSGMYDFWTAFQEFAKIPDSSVNQNLVVQKGVLFVERAQGIVDNMKSYQSKINTKISESIDRINELGHTIQELNLQIQKVEAGKVETAMTLRDERDNALDELSQYAQIDFSETPDGIVKVKLEGVQFVDEVHVFEMGKKVDKATGFITPTWPHLSDASLGHYTNVFDYSVDISSEMNTDIGILKAQVLARGDHVANYTDVTGLTADQYNDGAGMSVMLSAQAEFDQLVHGIMTAINDVLSPLTTKSFTGADGTVYNNVKVWDEEKGCVGNDGEKPGRELFVRRGMDRYREVTADDGKVYYVYNEEDTTDTSKMYTTYGVSVNQDLLDAESNLPYLRQNGEVAQAMAEELAAVWEKKGMILNPNDTDPCTFEGYYEKFMNELSTKGNVYESIAQSLSGSVTSISNQRQQVIGVSSDEELTNMIKYQNAYNAASRYINVISEMLEHIITQLG